MTGKFRVFGSFVLAAMLCASAAVADESKISGFTLPDIHGKDRSLDEFAKSDIVVVAFIGTECPLARLYAPRLEELSKEYGKRGVAFLAIDANSQDSLSDMTNFANTLNFTIPLLKDRDQSVADKFGCERNPQVFVLDKERKVRYHGRIDDQYGLGSSSGYAKTEIKTRNLGDALDELLAGKPVSAPHVAATGCLIGRTPKIAPSGDVTYTKHIAKVLEDRCVRCHRPNQIGPFALTDYQEVAGWGPMIKEVVNDGRMPPWSASPAHGTFRNDTRLSDAEKALVVAWVDNGCPQGDLADLPQPKTWVDGWQIGEPDQIVKMAQPIHVKAEGIMNYQNVVIDPGWTEDKWITAVECVPGQRQVVHHIIVSVAGPAGGRGRGGAGGGLGAAGGGAPSGLGQGLGQRRDRAAGGQDQAGARGAGGAAERLRGLQQAGGDAGGLAQRLQGRGQAGGGGGGLGALGGGGGLGALGGGGAMLTAYVPGNSGTVYPEGVGAFVAAGSRINLQIHYTPNGTAVDDISTVGFRFGKPETIKKRSHGGSLANALFAIPPGDPAYKIVATNVVREDSLMLWMSPHMHVRGKAMKFEATYPDGTTEVLLDVPKYDFNWQMAYQLAEPKLLPTGTRLTCTALFDNSEENVANPDPTKTVRFGLQTYEEMMIGFYGTISVKDDAHVARAGGEAQPPTSSEN